MKPISFTFSLTITFLLLCSGVHAQAIHLHFPHFSGQAYEWKIFQGQKQITIQSGEIPQDGRVTLTMPEAYKDHIAYFNDFVAHTLDFEYLYTSGHWDQVLHHWLMINVRFDKGDRVFTKRLNAALSRMVQDDILSGFVEKAVPLLVEKGKDDLLPIIADHLENRPAAQAALSGSVNNMMASVKILIGKKAPDLLFHAPVRTQAGTTTQDITIETENLDTVYTILLFYQGECPLCEDALIDLANKYKWLKGKNVRVIAISADTTDKGFEKKIAYHQWPDN